MTGAVMKRRRWRAWRRCLMNVALALVVNAPVLFPGLAAAAVTVGAVYAAPPLGAPSVGGDTPPLAHWSHRVFMRGQRSMERLTSFFGQAGLLWVGILLSVAAFFAITSISSVVDVRMLALRRQGPDALPRYIGNGTRTFFRLLKDRRTPNTARGLLVVALFYWLLPTDLIPDASIVPGFVDDVVVAVSAAKGFIYLCPDALVATHAAAVEARSREHSRAR